MSEFGRELTQSLSEALAILDGKLAPTSVGYRVTLRQVADLAGCRLRRWRRAWAWTWAPIRNGRGRGCFCGVRRCHLRPRSCFSCSSSPGRRAATFESGT